MKVKYFSSNLLLLTYKPYDVNEFSILKAELQVNKQQLYYRIVKMVSKT